MADTHRDLKGPYRQLVGHLHDTRSGYVGLRAGGFLAGLVVIDFRFSVTRDMFRRFMPQSVARKSYTLLDRNGQEPLRVSSGNWSCIFD